MRSTVSKTNECVILDINMANLLVVVFITLLVAVSGLGDSIIGKEIKKIRNITRHGVHKIRDGLERSVNKTRERIDDLQLELFGENIAKELLRTKVFDKVPLSQLQDLVDELEIRHVFTKNIFGKDAILCNLCKAAIFKINLFSFVRRKTIFRKVCDIGTVIHRYNGDRFCEKFTEINFDLMNHIVELSKELKSDLVCPLLLYNKNCPTDIPELTWALAVPPASNVKTLENTEKCNKKPLKILHLTDFHISMDYEAGSQTDCGYPVCCKSNLSTKTNEATKSGYWGDYRDCDIPPYMFKDTLAYLNSTFKDVDYVYFTGDIVDHAIWDSTIEKNTNALKYAYNSFKETFPGKKVLPLIGNHESHPLNVYSPPDLKQDNFSTQWLYDLLSDLWKDWLPEEALRTAKEEGYYSISLPNRLRVIALNNNNAYIYNWWLWYDTTFVQNQLKWLGEQLLDAETKGLFVHILMHVGPGNRETILPWDIHYSKLVKRFSHIVKGQFMGHVHGDELKVFFDEDSQKAVGIGFNGGSLTPYSNYNPNIKMMTVDSCTADILDIQTFVFNLTEANMNPNKSPRWYELYSMKKDFNLQDLSPESMGALADRFFKEDELFQQYYKYYFKDSSTRPECDKNCKKEMICTIFTTISLNSPMDECN